MIVIKKNFGIELLIGMNVNYNNVRLYEEIITNVIERSLAYNFIETNPNMLQYERSDEVVRGLSILPLTDDDLRTFDGIESKIIAYTQSEGLGHYRYALINHSKISNNHVLTSYGDHRIEEWENGRGRPKTSTDDLSLEVNDSVNENIHHLKSVNKYFSVNRPLMGNSLKLTGLTTCDDEYVRSLELVREDEEREARLERKQAILNSSKSNGTIS